MLQQLLKHWKTLSLYDGAAVFFSGCRSRVYLRMHIHAAHAMFIHCACHRLQLTSVQAAENVTEIIIKIRYDGEYLETVQLLPQKS